MTDHSAVSVTHVRKGLATSISPASTRAGRMESSAEPNRLPLIQPKAWWGGKAEGLV